MWECLALLFRMHGYLGFSHLWGSQPKLEVLLNICYNPFAYKELDHKEICCKMLEIIQLVRAKVGFKP